MISFSFSLLFLFFSSELWKHSHDYCNFYHYTQDHKTPTLLKYHGKPKIFWFDSTTFSAARIAMLKIHTSTCNFGLTDADLEAFAEKTDGFSGSDLSNVVMTALFEPIRDMQQATHWIETKGRTKARLKFVYEAWGTSGQISDHISSDKYKQFTFKTISKRRENVSRNI